MICSAGPNGLHRVSAMRRLAFEHLPFLQGYCEWCGRWCQALKVVGSRWYTEQQFAERYMSFVIPELP